MPRTMGQHHTTITARTEDELERSVTSWRERFEHELAAFQSEPDGITTTVRGCEGPHTQKLRPFWAKTCEQSDPRDLEFSFTVTRSTHGERLRADCCAVLTDRIRSEPPPEP